MGSKQTKIEGSYLPETPQILTHISAYPVAELQNPITVQTIFGSDALDPRSPNGCRTPISALRTQSTTTLQRQIETPSNNCGDHALGLLRKRFLRGFSSNLHDPRSPSSQVTRTPLVFDENDRTLNLDDTFSDLFVESRTPAEPNITVHNVDAGQMLVEEEVVIEIPTDLKRFFDDDSSLSIRKTDNSLDASSFCYEEEETMPCPDIPQQTPNGMHQQLDPRSPTFGVERTPIIFTDDDDEAAEEAMLENILATLSLDLSTGSSIASLGSPVVVKEEEKRDDAASVQLMNLSRKPTNKHLERVRIAKKRSPMHKAIARSQRNRIYEDSENLSPSNNTTRTIDTPKSKTSLPPLTPLSSFSSSVNKRTPLSCVKNRPHLRSRSMESSAKSLKARLALTSFDDSLNPVQNSKVTNLRIMEGGSKDSGDLIDSPFH